MRPPLIIVVSAVVLAIAATWGLAFVIAPHPKDTNAASASASIDATQMMKDAGNLAVERFDAH
jgi:hypothetical protein